MQHVLALALPLVLGSTTLATAGIRDRVRQHVDREIAREVRASVSHHVDLGLEASLMGAGTTSGELDGVVGLDLVLGVYREHRYPKAMSVVDRVIDHQLHRDAAAAWPTLARPQLELHLGGTLDLDADRAQGRLGIGTGLGPLGVGVAGTLDRFAGSTSFAVSPELRLRHRRGPAEHSPSFGGFVRADVFVDREVADRVTVGLYGMFDVF